MATLNEIENFLNIETADKRLRSGKKYDDKNRYYYYNELYYIVELTRGKWMICSDNRETRQLLRDCCWFYHHSGYAPTRVGNTQKLYHQLYLNYEEGLVCDHANRNKFDNRSDNFRIVTQKQNTRNRCIPSNNRSNKQGVCRQTKSVIYHYWTARIVDNDGNELSKAYNINKLGDDEAKRQAIEQRLAWEVLYDYRGE